MPSYPGQLEVTAQAVGAVDAVDVDDADADVVVAVPRQAHALEILAGEFWQADANAGSSPVLVGAAQKSEAAADDWIKALKQFSWLQAACTLGNRDSAATIKDIDLEDIFAAQRTFTA
jgi:hypothetical protein